MDDLDKPLANKTTGQTADDVPDKPTNTIYTPNTIQNHHSTDNSTDNRRDNCVEDSSDNSSQHNSEATDTLQLPLMSHLAELRKRFITVFVVFAVVFFVLMTQAQTLYAFVAQPLIAELPQNSMMISINPTGSFVANVKVTMYITAMTIMPVILWQIWAFVAPALYSSEKKLALPIVSSAVVLFYLGVEFAYTLLTHVLSFLIGFAAENVATMPDVESYLSFVLNIFLAFGLAFEIPIITLLLVLSRLVSVDWLQDKRRYIIVACFGIAAIITPPDGWSMVMLAIPMCLLFEFGIVLSKIVSTVTHKSTS